MALLTPDLGFIFWHTVILAVALFVLGRYAWKPILQAIGARERAYEEAVETMRKAEAEVAQLETTKAGIIEAAHAQSDRVLQEALERKEVILKEAEQEAMQEKQRILDHALQLVQLEKQAAQSAIKERTIALVLHTTEKLITRELTSGPTQQQLIQRMMEEVEQTHNPT